MMDFSRIDSLAASGYQHAAGTLKNMPQLLDQLDIDAFNAGISNFNVRQGMFVPNLMEGMKIMHIQGSNNGCADKELAIVGA